jgi:putative sugar O-methyltransferase
MHRISFSGIENKTHPNAKKRNFDFKQNKLIDNQIGSLVDEILDLFSMHIKDSLSGTGEWEWLQENKQKNFINSLINSDSTKISDYLNNMFRNEVTYGYISPSFSDALKQKLHVASDILCNIDTCAEFTDLSTESQLESLHGNPFGLIGDNGLILPDTSRHFYYANVISKLLKNKANPSILEIGGGYGGLCLQTWNRYEGKCTITNVDLLPALIATYFYLSKNKIPVNFLRSKKDFKLNSVNLIAANSSELLNSMMDKVDLVFNSRSLCEMSKETISQYLDFINLSNADYFYHENSNFVLFPDSERHLEIIAEDFPLDKIKYALEFSCVTPFTGGKGRYREYIFKKNSI